MFSTCIHSQPIEQTVHRAPSPLSLSARHHLFEHKPQVVLTKKILTRKLALRKKETKTLCMIRFVISLIAYEEVDYLTSDRALYQIHSGWPFIYMFQFFFPVYLYSVYAYHTRTNGDDDYFYIFWGIS